MTTFINHSVLNYKVQLRIVQVGLEILQKQPSNITAIVAHIL